MTNNLWARLSDTKKGAVALIGAVVFGFIVATMTIAQVGLPKRVDALEATDRSYNTRIAVLENERLTAGREREAIGKLLNWQTCAIEAINDSVNIREICGSPPRYLFGRVD